MDIPTVFETLDHLFEEGEFVIIGYIARMTLCLLKIQLHAVTLATGYSGRHRTASRLAVCDSFYLSKDYLFIRFLLCPFVKVLSFVEEIL